MNSTKLLLNADQLNRLLQYLDQNLICAAGLKWLCLALLLGSSFSMFAQAASFPGIHAESLDLFWQNHPAGAGFQPCHLSRLHTPRLSPATFSRAGATAYRPLPRFYPDKSRLPWSEDCLPFFCRIEHQWGKNKALPVKFRLGSVDYVDWLEGKSRFSTFAP